MLRNRVAKVISYMKTWFKKVYRNEIKRLLASDFKHKIGLYVTSINLIIFFITDQSALLFLIWMDKTFQ